MVGQTNNRLLGATDLPFGALLVGQTHNRLLGATDLPLGRRNLNYLKSDFTVITYLGVENAEADGMNRARSPKFCMCSELECERSRQESRVGLNTHAIVKTTRQSCRLELGRQCFTKVSSTKFRRDLFSGPICAHRQTDGSIKNSIQHYALGCIRNYDSYLLLSRYT